jgi:hypothetical protein
MAASPEPSSAPTGKNLIKVNDVISQEDAKEPSEDTLDRKARRLSSVVIVGIVLILSVVLVIAHPLDEERSRWGSNMLLLIMGSALSHLFPNGRDNNSKDKNK